MMKPNFGYRSGFSLIELLVAVAIIGILMAAGIYALTNTQRNARDAKRRADAIAIASAMEQFYIGGNLTYPTASYATNLASFFAAGLPTDSKGNAYTITSTVSQFCICIILETTGKGNASGLGAGGACTYVANGNYFCASNRN